jgi:hypothetical protein
MLAKQASERRFYVCTQVVGVPKRRPYSRGLPAAAHDGGRRQVGGVCLEYVGALRPNQSSDLVETPEQMVRAVVRKGGARHPQHSGAWCLPLRRRVACVTPAEFIARPRGNYGVVVTELA